MAVANPDDEAPEEMFLEGEDAIEREENEEKDRDKEGREMENYSKAAHESEMADGKEDGRQQEVHQVHMHQ